MTDADTLLALERGFWDADAGFYREHFAEDGLCVLPIGVLHKAATVAGIEGADPWTDVRFADVQTRQVAPDAAVVVYAATARRDGATEPYEVAVSSLYVRRRGGYQLLVHQQTPLPPAAGA